MNENEIIVSNFLYRGSFISSIITLEKSMELFLANYFCNSQQLMEEMVLLILGNERLSFENKKQISLKIISKKYPLFKPQKSPFKDDTQTLETQLQALIIARNVFAHCETVLSESHCLQTDKIVFYKFKDNFKFIEFSYEKIDLLIKRAEYYSENFFILSEQIKNQKLKT